MFFFFLGIFFLRTLDCLVSNCSLRNFQFIGIKFIVLPLPPSCWNMREKICLHVWISISVKWSVKLWDLPVFRRGNHWETIISKSIAVSYPGNFMIHDMINTFVVRPLKPLRESLIGGVVRQKVLLLAIIVSILHDQQI